MKCTFLDFQCPLSHAPMISYCSCCLLAKLVQMKPQDIKQGKIVERRDMNEVSDPLTLGKKK
jgi:hypothetical protein